MLESRVAHGVFPIRMACPLCGDRCTCSSATAGREIMGTCVSVLIEPSPEATGSNADWRDEVASRVTAHRAKRRRRYDPESSLSLSFTSAEVCPSSVTNRIHGYQQTSSAPQLQPPGTSDSEATRDSFGDPHEDARPSPYRRILLTPSESSEIADDNVIQFPRAAEQNALFDHELAEPIFSTPRILDSPENSFQLEQPAPTLPPLASIHLDDFVSATHTEDWSSDGNFADQIELPLQVASMSARTLCAITDAVVVLTATALFSVIVLSIAKFVPEGRLAAAAAALLPLALWSAYHYLFLVYAGATPGMQMAQLELSSFEGCVPMRKIRAWRAVSMLLSCASLGLGFAWAVVDEDRLSWHDRITRTYLRQS